MRRHVALRFAEIREFDIEGDDHHGLIEQAQAEAPDGRQVPSIMAVG